MKNKTYDLTTGNLWKKMFLFCMPLIASNLLQAFFNIADIAVVGRFGSVIALGAVGSTPILVFLFYGILMGLGGGINSVVARFIGAKSSREVKESTYASFIVALSIGIILAIIGEITSGPLLSLLNTKPELFSQAKTYLEIYFIGMPALAIYNFGNGIYSAAGDTKKPLMFLSISGVINICLNLFFVIIIGMEASGVALATTISEYISATLIIISLIKRNDDIALKFKNIKLSLEKVKLVLQIGLPGGFQNVMFAVSNLFIQAAINSFSTTLVEGNAAAANMDTLIYDTLAAVYVAGTSFIAQNFGAKNHKNIKKSYLIEMTYALGISITLGLLFYNFGTSYIGLFTTNTSVIAAGMKRVSILALTIWISTFMDGTIAASRGLGKTSIPTVFVIIGTCIFRIVWIYTLFNAYHTTFVLFIMYAVSWVITGIAEIVYFLNVYNKTRLEF